MGNERLSQWYILGKDKWLLASLTLLPVLLALSIWWIFSQSIARDLPIGVVDLENSSLSRQLIREFDATPALRVAQKYSDVLAAKEAFIGNDVYAYMVIPKNFDRDVALGPAPQVTVFYNSQYILVGKLINSAALQAQGTFNAQIGTLQQLAKGNTTTISALAKTVTISTQITSLFNQNSNYAQFLVSAIVPALWQISIVISTILFFAANYRIYGSNKIFTQQPYRNVIRMNMFYLPFFLVQGLAFLLWFYVSLGWPMSGSLWVLFGAQLITVAACMVMGNVFFLLNFDSARAMSFAAAFTAPSFAFMGVTFPASDMNILAKIWRSLLPISHYIEAQISQASYGLSAWQTLSGFTLSMLGYLVPLFFVFFLIKKHLKKGEVSHDTI
ncbi:MAG: ABC transporter permease [Marinomonas colpomeniae]